MAMNPLAQIPLDLTLFGDLDLEKVSLPSSITSKQCADDDPTEATPIKTVSDDPSPVALKSNDKVKHDADQNTSQSNDSIKVSGKDGEGPMEKVEEKPSSSVSVAAGTALVKEKSEDSTLESVEKPIEKPIALFKVRKKAATKRPKFRVAKARPKKSKAK